jgi:hypothetical protein
VFDAGTTSTVTFKFDPLFNKTKQSVKIVVKPVQVRRHVEQQRHVPGHLKLPT